MVLDAKALTWAAKHDIDTAKLKKAKVPIFGKWYFPEIPANVPLVNLETGEQQVFAERMIAGEVVYVPAADLQRAGLAPSDFTIAAGGPAVASERALRVIAPEPLLAMARPPGFDDGSTVAIEAVNAQPLLMGGAVGDASEIHLPSASIAPLVLAFGFCITLLGAISNIIIFIVGLLWMLAGSIGWIRIGLIEERAAEAHAAAEQH